MRVLFLLIPLVYHAYAWYTREMSYLSARTAHLSRWVTLPVPVQSGVCVERGTSPHNVTVASQGCLCVIGVTLDTVEAHEPVRIAGADDIASFRRDPSFTDPVVPGQRLAVGSGGRVIAASQALPAVAEVEAISDGSGEMILASVSPAAQVATLAAGILGVQRLRRVIGPGEGGQGVTIQIELDIQNADTYVVQVYSSAGEKRDWTGTVVPVAASPPNPARLDITWSNPNPGVATDQVMLIVGEE